MATPMRLGLTGGIGSGKSTVAGILLHMGAGLIDADAISRAATASHGIAMEPIRQQFGDAFVQPDGALHRERMRAHVFAHPEAKKALEAIIHPLVAQAIESQAQDLAQAGTACIVFDIPLLVESSRWRGVLDRVLVVDCSEATQVQRVQARSGLSVHEVQRIMATQAPRAVRLAAADWVLFNDGISIEELSQRVHEFGHYFGL